MYKGMPFKSVRPSTLYEISKNLKKTLPFSLYISAYNVLYYEGYFSEWRYVRQKPFARICNMHKSDNRFFGDNREISNFAVKGVPFLAIFVGIYGGTFFRDMEVIPMTRKVRRGKNTKQPVSVHRLIKLLYASRESVRTLSGFLGLPPKNPRAFRGRKTLTPTGSDHRPNL